jgi:hypothetical protein
LTHETAAAPNPPSQHGFLGFLSRKKHGRKKRKKKNRKNHRPRATDDQILQNQNGTQQFLSLFFSIKEQN